MSGLFYHYTSLNVLFNIVSHNELWLSNLKNSNDPNELYLSCDEYNGYICNNLPTNPYHCTPVIVKPDHIVGNPYGLSLTTLEDDLGQWERYADQSRGVAIAFDIQAMNDYFDENYGFVLDFDSIKYTESEKIEYIKSLVKDMPVYELPLEKSWPLYATFFTIHYSLARVLFKKSAFSIENEYRLYIDLVERKFQKETLELLIAREPDKLQEFQEEHRAMERIHQLTEENKKYAPMRNGINSYLSLNLSLLGPVKKGFIKKIVLGPKCTQNIDIDQKINGGMVP